MPPFAFVNVVPPTKYTILTWNNYGSNIADNVTLPPNCSPTTFNANISSGTASMNVSCTGKMVSIVVNSASCASGPNCYIFVNAGWNSAYYQGPVFTCQWFSDLTTNPSYSYGSPKHTCASAATVLGTQLVDQ